MQYNDEPAATHERAQVSNELTINQVEASERMLSAEDVLAGFEVQHFVKTAPGLREIAGRAENRSTKLTNTVSNEHLTSDLMRDQKGYDITQTHTESEALQTTLTFLDQLEADILAISLENDDLKKIVTNIQSHDRNKDETSFGGHQSDRMDMPNSDHIKAWLAEKIAALRETSFIGEPEIQEASAGLALYWKNFLAEDPEHQIVMLGIDSGKSAAYVLERVLEHFGEAELEQAVGRLVQRIDLVTSPKEKVKVIVLDDWLMSGDQMQQRMMSTSLYEFASDNETSDFIDEADLDAMLSGDPQDMPNTTTESKVKNIAEINCLVADERRLAHGFSYDVVFEDIPVKAFYVAPDASDIAGGAMDDRYFSRITGAHSSGDHHFSNTIHNVIAVMNGVNEKMGNGKPPYEMPPLTNILRQYRKLNALQTEKLFSNNEDMFEEEAGYIRF